LNWEKKKLLEVFILTNVSRRAISTLFFFLPLQKQNVYKDKEEGTAFCVSGTSGSIGTRIAA
jgi:hypothetical protein